MKGWFDAKKRSPPTFTTGGLYFGSNQNGYLVA